MFIVYAMLAALLMAPLSAGAEAPSLVQAGKWSYSTTPDEDGLYIARTFHQGKGNAMFMYACGNENNAGSALSFHLKTTPESLKRAPTGLGNLEYRLDDNKSKSLTVLTEVAPEEEWNMRMIVTRKGPVSSDKLLKQILNSGETLSIRIGGDSYLAFPLKGIKDAIGKTMSRCNIKAPFVISEPGDIY